MDELNPVSWQRYPSFNYTFRDGVSNTLLITEKYAKCSDIGGNIWAHTNPDYFQPTFAAWTLEKFQYRPSFSSEPCDPRRASTPFTGGINVCLADGSVRAVAYTIRQQTWWSICTPGGGEFVDSDW